MNESIKKKINGLGRAGQIITTILIVLVSAYGGWLLLYVRVFSGRFINSLIASDYEALSKTASAFFGADFLSALFVAGGLLLILISLKRLANALRICDTPFSDTVMRRLNGYAWTRLICMAVIFVAVLVKKVLPFSLTRPSVIVMYACAFGVSVLFSVVILLLTRTFRHGAQLQKEVDETL